MKKIVSLSLMGLFAIAMASTTPAMADDNKVMAGAKKIGNGIMWGPRKLWSGTKALGKKMTGK